MRNNKEVVFPSNGSPADLKAWQAEAHIGHGRQVRVASTVLGSETLSEVKGWFSGFSEGELHMVTPWAAFDPEGNMTRYEVIDSRIPVTRIRSIHGTTGLGVLSTEARIMEKRNLRLAGKK